MYRNMLHPKHKRINLFYGKNKCLEISDFPDFIWGKSRNLIKKKTSTCIPYNSFDFRTK